DQPLLLGERLNLSAIDVGLGDNASAALLQRLAIKGVGSLQLSARRVQPRFRRDHLKVGAADGQDDEIVRVLGRLFVGSHDLFGRAVVFPCRHVYYPLGQGRAKVEEVERPHDGRYGEARNQLADLLVKAEACRPQVYLLDGFAQIPAQVREQ